jgi:PAS domain S-box-containing protein
MTAKTDQLAFKHAPVAMAYVRSDLKFIRGNPALFRLLGYNAKELKSLSLADISDSDDETQVNDISYDLMAGKSVQIKFRKKDGDSGWGSVSLTPIKNSIIASLFGILVIEDITQYKCAENILFQRLNRKHTEEELADFFENAPVGFHWVGADGYILWANRVELELLGYTREEFVGHHASEFHVEQHVLEDIFRRLNNCEDIHNYEVQLQSKDGSIKTVLLDSSVVRDNGKFLYTRCFTRDITERKKLEAARREADITRRKQAEEALYESESLFRILTETTTASIYIYRGNRYIYVNPTAVARTGYTSDELKGMKVWDLMHPDYRRIVRAWFKSRSNGANNPGARYELKIMTKSGTELWSEVVTTPIIFEGQPSVLVTSFDITDRKRAEDSLRESEAKNRAILKAIPDLMFLMSKDGVYLDYHAKDRNELLMPPEQFIGKSYREVLPPHTIEPFDRCFEQVRTSGELVMVEYSAQVGERAGNFEARVVSCDNDRVLAIVRDITERKQAEERLRRFFDLPLVGMAVTLPDTRFLMVNQKLCDMLGYDKEELTGMTWVEVTHPDDIAENIRLLEQTRRGETEGYYMDKRFIHRNGRLVYTSISARCVRREDEERTVDHLVLIVQDITERQRTEEALRKSHEQVQDLAGKLIVAQEEERKYIARELHDDLIQKVAGLAICLGKLDRQLPQSDKSIRGQITKLENRISELSVQLRRLSHELHSSTLEHVGLAAALKLYCSEFSEQEEIAVTLNIEEDIEPVPAETALCLYRVTQEALRNIAKHSGAKIAKVSLAGVGHGLELSIADHGTGFDPEKEKGRLGLGLISIEERVKLMHGSFQVDSTPGAGTTLRVSVPLS